MASVRLSVGKAAVVLVLSTVLSSCLRPPSQGPTSAANLAAVPARNVAAVAGTAALPSTSAANFAAAPATAGLPASLSWTSSGPLIIPVSDAAHDLVAVKDPTVVRYNDRWHVYATSVARGGVYGMVYLSFADWGEASKASFYTMDKTPGFNTYVAAPQLFYFTAAGWISG